MSDDLFQHAGDFHQGEVSGNVRLGKFEAQYEELFSEALEDGVITSDERTRLDRAAESLGLDRARMRQLESALAAAYEVHHRRVVREEYDTSEDEAPRGSLRPLELDPDQRIQALQRRIRFLESRVGELEKDLEEAQSHIAVEVDFSDFTGSDAAPPPDDPDELYRQVRRDPRDPAILTALFRACQAAGDTDRCYRVAHALSYLGKAEGAVEELYAAHRVEGLIKPTASLTPDAWRRNLFHPDEEALTGEIFSVVISPVLFGRVATLRHQKLLPKLDEQRRQDPATSTVQAVRCFAWAASLLGMTTPPLYADPQNDGIIEMVPGVPPASRLGKGALSGRSPTELAFIAGRHLASYREDHFIRLLLPSIPDLEDIFLAALTIGNPGLPLTTEVRARVAPIAQAIEPILEPASVDRLRGHFLRFVEEGGRTNLQRWSHGADLTTTRAGFLLCDDFSTTQRMLELEGASDVSAKMDDLLVFALGERCGNLRKQIGIAIPAPPEA